MKQRRIASTLYCVSSEKVQKNASHVSGYQKCECAIIDVGKAYERREDRRGGFLQNPERMSFHLGKFSAGSMSAGKFGASDEDDDHKKFSIEEVSVDYITETEFPTLCLSLGYAVYRSLLHVLFAFCVHEK